MLHFVGIQNKDGLPNLYWAATFSAF